MSERASLTVGLGSNAPRGEGGLSSPFRPLIAAGLSKEIATCRRVDEWPPACPQVPAGVRTEQQVMTLRQRAYAVSGWRAELAKAELSPSGASRASIGSAGYAGKGIRSQGYMRSAFIQQPPAGTDV